VSPGIHVLTFKGKKFFPTFFVKSKLREIGENKVVKKAITISNDPRLKAGIYTFYRNN
jgi:hypothetical protein